MNTWVAWPSLDEELESTVHHLTGTVLNAGAGMRDVTLPFASRVVRMDLKQAGTPDIVGDLERIPMADGEVDSILCVAVLEHCRRPWLVVDEFARVLRTSGRIVCAVPFSQPIHLEPSDYFRFAPEGIRSLFEDRGFRVLQLESTHGQLHSIIWQLEEAARQHGLGRSLDWLFARAGRYLTRRLRNWKVESNPCVLTIVAERT